MDTQGFPSDAYSPILDAEVRLHYEQIDWRSRALPHKYFLWGYTTGVAPNITNYMYFTVMIFDRQGIATLLPLYYTTTTGSVTLVTYFRTAMGILPLANPHCQGVQCVQFATHDAAGWTTAIQQVPEFTYRYHRPNDYFPYWPDLADDIYYYYVDIASPAVRPTENGSDARAMRYFANQVRIFGGTTGPLVQIDLFTPPDTSAEQAAWAQKQIDDQAHVDADLAASQELGSTAFPRTPYLHMVFWDGHSIYIPNGTMIHAVQSRLLEQKLGVTRMWIVVTSTADPFGLVWRAAVAIRPFVAYGRGPDYNYPSRRPILIPFPGQPGSTNILNFIRTTTNPGPTQMNEIITDIPTASRIGRDMERIDSIGHLRQLLVMTT